MLKAGEVFEIAMLAHDTPPSTRDTAYRRDRFAITFRAYSNLSIATPGNYFRFAGED
jgi:hypothetical protein